jgi:hypothetical protein
MNVLANHIQSLTPTTKAMQDFNEIEITTENKPIN